MKNKTSYKIIIIGFFALLLTTIAVIDTYALFETNGNATKNLTIGKWNILLNNIDVYENRTITLNDFVYTNGIHTQSNYFAPGSSAYFDLIIDASATDVSVAYDFTIDDSQIVDYPNIYFIITDMSNNQQINANTFSGIIPLSSQTRTKTIRITLNWTNDPDYDESDTSLIGENLAFTIDAHFEQYIEE